MLTHTEAAAAIKTFDTATIEKLLVLANASRSYLVNLDTGVNRAERIERNKRVVAVLEAELSARATDALLAALAASPDFVTVQDADHLATLLDVDEDEKAPTEENLTLSIEQVKALPRPADGSYEVSQRVLVVGLPHIGATVRSVDESGIGVDYDDDQPDDNYEAPYNRIRPMPYL